MAAVDHDATTTERSDGRYPGARYLLVFASLVVAIAGLRAAATLVIPMLLSVFVAVLSLPMLLFLQRHKVPTVLAVTVTVLAEIAVLSGVGFLVLGSVNEFTTQLPGYQQILERGIANGVGWLQERGVPLNASDFVDPSRVMGVVQGVVATVVGVVQNTVLVILTTIFILLEAAYIPRKFRLAFGARKATASRWSKTIADVQRYLGLKTLISVLTGLLVAGWLTILGIDFPVFWGITAFFLNYIPSIGSIVAAIPTVLIAAVQFGLGRAALVALGYVAINILFGNLIEPTIMGRRFGLSTLVVFLSLLFWGWVWGPVGMLLSVPLTIILKIMLENSQDFRWLAVMLGTGKRQPAGPR